MEGNPMEDNMEESKINVDTGYHITQALNHLDQAGFGQVSAIDMISALLGMAVLTDEELAGIMDRVKAIEVAVEEKYSNQEEK